MVPHVNTNLYFSLLLGTSVLTACYVHLKLGVHQRADLWLVLATLVLTAFYTDVHQNLTLRLSKYCFSAASGDLCDHSLLVGLEVGGANFRCCWQPATPRSKNNTPKRTQQQQITACCSDLRQNIHFRLSQYCFYLRQNIAFVAVKILFFGCFWRPL